MAGPAAMEQSVYDAHALFEEMELSKVREEFIEQMRAGFSGERGWHSTPPRGRIVWS